MESVVTIIISALFIGGLVFQIVKFYVKTPKEEKELAAKNSLYHASVTDNGTPVNEVFETLKDNGITINYLGKNWRNIIHWGYADKTHRVSNGQEYFADLWGTLFHIIELKAFKTLPFPIIVFLNISSLPP